MQQFTSIGIIGRQDNRSIIDSLLALTEFLQQRAHIKIYVDEAVSALLGQHTFEVCPSEKMGECCKLAIVVGGDGSMLKAAAQMAEQHIPVVGINRGQLGFLTDILPEEIEKTLGPILDGQYKVESRFLLEASIPHEGNERVLGSAMNDVVLHPGIAVQMIEFELYIDGSFVYHQASDGLIVATPTGSTAYSMSAGGPIMHPKLDAIVLVPMYPHSLSSRPIVIDSSSEVTIVVGERHHTSPQISCDGSVQYTSIAGDIVTIRRKSQELHLLHPVEYDYYETCRSKLGWSLRPGKGE